MATPSEPIDPQSPEPSSPALTVYYDGSCPLCRREISWYQRKDSERQINWIDVTRVDQVELGPGLDPQSAMDRIHVRAADGDLKSGSEAFAAIWSKLPGFRLIGRIASIRWVSALLEVFYKVFLRFRPGVQRAYRRMAGNPQN